MLVPWIAAGSRSCSERLTGSEWSSPLKVSAGCRWRCRSFVQHYSNKSSWSSHPGRLTSNRWQRLVLHLSFQIQGECLKVAEIRDWDKSYTNSWRGSHTCITFSFNLQGEKKSVCDTLKASCETSTHCEKQQWKELLQHLIKCHSSKEPLGAELNSPNAVFLFDNHKIWMSLLGMYKQKVWVFSK